LQYTGGGTFRKTVNEGMNEEREMTIAAALGDVRGRIAAAAKRAGRSPEEVALLAVAKTVPVERIREAVEAGQLLFGENRVQEAGKKVPAFGPPVTWHMIGHLQKNKVKAAVELFDAVESVDSRELARRLDGRAAAARKVMPVLIQVKEAEEAAKSGVGPEGLPGLIKEVLSLAGLELKGLMVIPPWPNLPEDSRPYFARLRKLRDRWDGRCCPPGTLGELSMGMTADFEVAVEEGATIVRVGSAVFGSRPLP
jgi:pyridoxal phosphate enzyme (YggS family)